MFKRKLCCLYLNHWPLEYVAVIISILSDHTLWVKLMSAFSEIALSWMLQNTFDEKSTLVQVTVCCRQATNHYLSQCWPRCMSTYGVTRPQQVKMLTWAYVKLLYKRQSPYHAGIRQGPLLVAIHFYPVASKENRQMVYMLHSCAA